MLNRPRKIVLVVDDDPEALDATCRIVGNEYPVLDATCGQDALRMAVSVQPDLIVLDVMMPGGMDGFTVMSKLRSNAATRSIPIIILSGITESSELTFENEDFKTYLGCSPDAFVAKPAPASVLLNAVRKTLGPSAIQRAG